MKGNAYTLIYALLLGTACALLLTAASEFTKPYRVANAEAEETFNILKVLGIPFEEGTDAAGLLAISKENVKEKKSGDVTLYEYALAGGKVIAVALPFEGQGLWGPIKGFLALEPDMRTIKGVTFYQQEETPGLGGEISTESFTTLFSGKSIINELGQPGISIKAGAGNDVNGVDVISGATMTCDKVQEMINEAVVKIVDTE
ncbi:MAG: FMN-binding protein [Planctomycetes bacterium]|nr:FMN-binding protein [Planctomycetota bacterium]